MPANSTSETSGPGRRYFLLFCPAERRAEYDRALRDGSHEVELVSTVADLLGCCVDEPPLAAILDMAAVTQSGSAELAPIFDLRMRWPVIRCNVLPDGSLSALCIDPPQHGPLLKLLDSIAAGESVWRRKLSSPRHQRLHLRRPVKCRVRLRVCGEDRWCLGNALDLSAGGAFVITYESFPMGAEVELEVRDLLDEAAPMRASVARVQRWEDGRELPGVALKFAPATVSRQFKRALADSLKLAELAQ